MERGEQPVFKGLQRPLEFMGLQGRYIWWGAATAGGAIAGFIVGYCLLGFVAGLAVLAAALALGIGMIMLRQRRGLHTKKRAVGVFVYSRKTAG